MEWSWGVLGTRLVVERWMVESFAYTDREYFIYHFPQMLEHYIDGKKKDLGYQGETSIVIGIDWYHYTESWWLHAWGNWLPYHYGHTDYAYHNAAHYQTHLEEGMPNT